MTKLARAAVVACAVAAGTFVPVAAVSVGGATEARAEAMRFSSPREAYRQGKSAFVRQQYEIAVPALEAAHEGNIFLAPFLLARIFSSGPPAYIDHASAYFLYKGIVEKFSHTVRGDDLRRGTTVGKSITAMAKYMMHGLPEASVPADPAKAVTLLDYAARHFNEADAQFELARLQLVGDGVKKNEREALYWIRHLADDHHAGATAMLAQLYWQGKIVQRRPMYALFLIHRALKLAPDSEVIWMKDIYQSIFCGSSPDVRDYAAGSVAGWDKRMSEAQSTARSRQRAQRDTGLSNFSGPVRTCADGEPVRMLDERSSRAPDASDETTGPGSSAPAFAAPSDPGRDTPYRRSPRANVTVEEETFDVLGDSDVRGPTETMRSTGFGGRGARN